MKITNTLKTLVSFVSGLGFTLSPESWRDTAEKKKESCLEDVAMVNSILHLYIHSVRSLNTGQIRILTLIDS